MLRGESDPCRPRPVRRDQRVPKVAVGEVDDLVVRIQDLGDRLVLGVVFPGQLEVRCRELKLALGLKLGAQADLLAEEFGLLHTGECRRLSEIRKWPLRPRTHENGLES